MTDTIRSRRELEALPNAAVVYDHDCRVWQHGYVGRLYGWLLPGDANVYSAKCVALPAHLLDDGL